MGEALVNGASLSCREIPARRELELNRPPVLLTAKTVSGAVQEQATYDLPRAAGLAEGA